MKYNCDPCTYCTNRKSSYDRHLTSTKHKTKTREYNNMEKKIVKRTTDALNCEKLFQCSYCKASYKHQRSMKRHMNACSNKTEYLLKYEESEKKVEQLLKNNTELKENFDELKEDNKKLKEKYELLIEKYDIKRDELEESLIENNKNGKNPNVFSFVEGKYLKTKPLKQMSDGDVLKLDSMNEILEKEDGEMEMCNVLQHHSLHKTLKDFVGDILRSIYEKDDKSTQQFFVSDCSRLSYIIRDIVGKKSVWRRDNKGVILSKRIIDPILQYIREHLSKHMADYLTYVLDEFPDDKLESVNRIQRLTHIITSIDNGKLQHNILKYLAVYFQLDKSIIEGELKKMIKRKERRKRLSVDT